jgi:hypothetical protein
MKRKKLLLLLGSFILIGVVVEVILAVKDIGAGARCKGASCVGLDAKDLNCDGQIETLVGEIVQGIAIELRYSPACDASWAKANVPEGSILYVQDVAGHQFGHYTVPPDGITTAHYGNMGAGKMLKACTKLPSSERVCTKLSDSIN